MVVATAENASPALRAYLENSVAGTKEGDGYLAALDSTGTEEGVLRPRSCLAARSTSGGWYTIQDCHCSSLSCFVDTKCGQGAGCVSLCCSCQMTMEIH